MMALLLVISEPWERGSRAEQCPHASKSIPLDLRHAGAPVSDSPSGFAIMLLGFPPVTASSSKSA